MLSATDAFPDTTPADQRHTQVVVGDHLSEIDEDEREDEVTSHSDPHPTRRQMLCTRPMISSPAQGRSGTS